MKRIVLAVSLTISMLVSMGSAIAAGPNNYMAPWAQLSPEERSVLQSLQQTWDKLYYKERERLLRVVVLYPKMSELEKQRFSSRLLQWTTLTRTERNLTRQRYVKFSKLSKERQVEIKKQWQERQAQRQGSNLPTSNDAAR